MCEKWRVDRPKQKAKEKMRHLPANTYINICIVYVLCMYASERVRVRVRTLEFIAIIDMHIWTIATNCRFIFHHIESNIYWDFVVGPSCIKKIGKTLRRFQRVRYMLYGGCDWMCRANKRWLDSLVAWAKTEHFSMKCERPKVLVWYPMKFSPHACLHFRFYKPHAIEKGCGRMLATWMAGRLASAIN